MDKTFVGRGQGRQRISVDLALIVRRGGQNGSRYQQTPVPVTQGVVGTGPTRDGDGVSSRWTRGRGSRAQGDWLGQIGGVVAFDKPAVSGAEGRQSRAVGDGLIVRADH